jgi:hypothetical protein
LASCPIAASRSPGNCFASNPNCSTASDVRCRSSSRFVK